MKVGAPIQLFCEIVMLLTSILLCDFLKINFQKIRKKRKKILSVSKNHLPLYPLLKTEFLEKHPKVLEIIFEKKMQT